MDLTYVESKTDLIINTLSRQMYKELKLSSAIHDDEIYLIDDDGIIDAGGGRIISVAAPEVSSDAATKAYVDAVSANIPTKVSQLTNDSGYLTQHQSLSEYYTKSQTNALSTAFRSGLATTDYAASVGPVTKVNNQTGAVSVYVPTKLSEFTNDQNFISSVPDTYKTYADTKGQLSTDGYTVKSDLTKINLDGTETHELNVVHMARSEYTAKVKADDGSILSNTIYILSAEDVNAYGQKITNVGEPILSGDAATKNYVDEAISSIPELTKATSTVLGGIKIGYSSANHNYAVQLDSNDKAYVNVPWTDVAISSARYDSAAKQIVLVFNDATKTALSVNVADLVDTYTAGRGLKVINNQFSVSADYAEISSVTKLSNSLSDYYTKSQLSSATQINTALAGKQPVGNYISSIHAGYGLSADGNTVGLSVFNTSISVDGKYVSEFMTRHVSMTEYAQILLEGALSNTLYIVSSETNDMAGYRIINVGYPEELSDATTKQYVDEEISKIDIVSQLTPYQKKYILSEPMLTYDEANGQYVCQLSDYSIMTITPTNDTAIKLVLPTTDTNGNFARDFMVRLELTEYNPTIQFAVNSSSSENVSYEAEDEEWASFENGINIVSFTETRRTSASTKFMVSKKFYE